MKSRRWLSALLACSALAGTAPSAAAAYPDRPVRMVVGIAPGGSTDTAARVIAAKLAERWGQPVVIDNRPGADGSMAEELVARATPDGYSMVVAYGSHNVNSFVMKLSFDPVTSFTPVIRMTNTPLVLVVNAASVPVKNFDEFIAYVRANPGKLNYGHGGEGTSPNLAMLFLMKATGIRNVPVAYKGMAPATVSLVGNEIQVMFGSPTVVVPHIATGRLVPLAITSSTRSRGLPNVPTVAEAAHLPDFSVDTWTGILVHSGTPRAVVSKIHDDVAAILQIPEVQKALAAQGFDVIGGSPEEFAEFSKKERARLADLFGKAPR